MDKTTRTEKASVGSGRKRGFLGPPGRTVRLASFSLVELLASSVILSILAVSAVPFAETQRNRRAEVELREALLKVRKALHLYAYNEFYDNTLYPGSMDDDRVFGEDPAGDPDMDGIMDDDLDGLVDEDGSPVFPTTLDMLVERKYLPSLPRDPISLVPTEATTWQTLSVVRTMTPARELRGIYDVRSFSTEISLAGTTYDSW